MAKRGHRGIPRTGYDRTLRVNQVIRQVLGDQLERLADAEDRLAMVTITEVEISPDLSTAKVFFASLSPEQAEALEERRGQLQAAVNREITLKRTPKLTFLVDPSIEAGSRIDELLRRTTED